MDISDPPTEAEQEERAETEREETPKEEMKKDGETVEERESGTGQQPVEGEETSGSGGEIGGEKKSEKDAATPDRSAIVTS